MVAFAVALLGAWAPLARADASATYFAKSYALLIGNDEYGNGWNHLRNGVKDAEEMAAELARHGFHTVVKRNLRRRELIEALETFFIETGSDPDARLVVWFSGHGYTVNGEGYLVPSGAPGPGNDVRFRQGAVSVREFGRLMREAKSRHVLAILDSCFSGTVFANVRGGNLPPPVEHVIGLPVRQMISSGRAGEVVADDGRFRELVIEALSNRRAAADPNQDGYVLGSNLGQFLFDEVSSKTDGRQNPQVGKLDDPRFNQGDFVFRMLPLGTALTPSAAPVAKPVDTRPKTFVDTAVEILAREAAAVHARLGSPALAGLLGLMLFARQWRANARLLERLRPGTPGMNEEIAAAERAGLRAQTYRQTLQAWLDWLSVKLGGAHPFGYGAYDAMFRLAVVYPIVGVLLVWVITGDNTSGVEGLFPNADAAQRTSFVGILGLAVLQVAKTVRSSDWHSPFWLGTVAAAIAISFTIAGTATVAFAFSVAVALALAGPDLHLFIGYFVLALASAVAIAATFAVALAVAAIFAVAFAGPGPGSVAAAAFGALALASASSSALAVVAFYAIRALIERHAPSIGRGVTWPLLVAVVAAVPSFTEYKALSDLRVDLITTLLIFFAALPLINVVFDWLSLGVTRWLLAKTARGEQPIWNGLLDAIAAIFILFALAVATTAALQGLNTLAIMNGSDRALIDLAGVLQTLRERPGDPAVWWVYFMLFSTLVPSVVHLFIAATSIVTLSLPGFILRPHLAALEAGFDGHPQAPSRVALTMTIRQLLGWGAFAAALAAIVGVGFGLTNIIPWVGLAILWVAEQTAYVLKAPVTPGPPPWL